MVGQHDVLADRQDGSPPQSGRTLERPQQVLLRRPAPVQESLLDVVDRARDQRRQQRARLLDESSDVEDTLDALGERVPDRVPVAAETLEGLGEVLAAVDADALSGDHGGAERVGADVLLEQARPERELEGVEAALDPVVVEPPAHDPAVTVHQQGGVVASPQVLLQLLEDRRGTHQQGAARIDVVCGRVELGARVESGHAHAPPGQGDVLAQCRAWWSSGWVRVHVIGPFAQPAVM